MRALEPIAAVAGVLAFAGPAAATPQPCGGTPQIADALGDGHHPNTDVTAAWLSEQAGRLQAVIRPRAAVWEPAHDDSDAAGFALLYELGGQVRYVRAEAPRGGPVRFDHGAWTGRFATAGPATGAVAGDAVAIDVPGVLPGAVLARPYVLTYDGADGSGPHWVDRAPGGTGPDEAAFGADYVAGACAGAAPPGGSAATTAVALDARRRLVGGGRTVVAGRIAPPRAGVPVAVTATPTGGRSARAAPARSAAAPAARGATVPRERVRRAVTQADGSFALVLPVRETTALRAVAEGIGSQSRTITVVSTVRIRVRGATVRGRVRPALPGRVLLVRRGAVRPAATVRPRGGRFRIRVRTAGRYQAVFIPSGERAERSTSNTGVVR